MRTIILTLALMPAAVAAQAPEIVVEGPGPYVDAYRTVARQFEACYRVRGIWGNGYEVLTDLDTAGQAGRVELFYVGANGPKESRRGAVVTVTPAGEGARAVVTGSQSKHVEKVAGAVAGWLRGSARCNGK